jgi:tetratricopeptide (TPR) repeat protein
MSDASSCPRPEQLDRYNRGEMPPGEAAEFARHLQDCPACAARVETVQLPALRATASQESAAVSTASLPLVSPGPEDRAPTTRGPAAGHAQMTDSGLGVETVTAAPPTPVIPGYQIHGKLGHGGMGVVYQAEQVALKRTVALKVVLAGGHADAERLARFRGEAEAVARLKHSNIVQIYEVGEHGGLPFFSLEYVEGGSLQQRLNGTPLPAPAAAALLEVLARAMHHAHEEGIVHRDLKPSNILLDRHGIPKIADFGLAKRLDEGARHTASGAVLGTPSYMAPEQAAGHTAAVGHLADVYALGAILYETLTGRPPFKGATSADTLVQVLGQEPVPPRRLNPQVPRDLETICLKCLHKEPGRRYAHARALAEDLGSFQRGEPIQARPVGMLEHGWRWCRRNPAVTAVSAAALLLLIFALVGMTTLYLNAERQRDLAERERRRADDERKSARRAAAEAKRQEKEADDQRRAAHEQADRSQQVTEALKGMFEVSDPLGVQGFLYGSSDKLAGTRITALDLLGFCKERLKKSQGTSPRVRADILDTIGNVYRSLGRYDEAAELLQTAYTLRRKDRAPPREIAASLYSLGWLNHERGNYPRAVKLYRASLDLRLKEAPPDDAAIANSEFNLGWALGELEDSAEAEKLFKSCLKRRKKLFGADHRQTAAAKVGLAGVYLDIERYLEANLLVDQVIRTLRKISEDPILPDALAWFQEGVILSLVKNDHIGAEKKLRASLELTRRKLGPRHPYVAMPMVQLAMILEERGREHDAEAQALYEEALSIVEERVGLAHPKALVAVHRLTRVQRRRGQAKQAEAYYEKVLDACRVRFGPASPFVADVLYDYAEFLEPARGDRYQKLLQDAVAIYRVAEGLPRRRCAPCLNALGVLRFNGRNYAESERLFREALSVLGKQPYAPAALRVRTRANAAHALLAQGNVPDEVGAWLSEAEALLRRLSARERRVLSHDVVLYRCTYVRLARADHAEVVKRLDEYRASMLPDPWRLEDVALQFAQCLPLVDGDPKLAAEEKARLRAEYGSRAVALLRQAWEKRRPSAAGWENDPRLQPLRDREDYQQLLIQVRKN